MNEATTMDTFDEMRLRADIAAKWGHHGAHINVFDFMVNEIMALRSVVEQATKGVTEGNGHVHLFDTEEVGAVLCCTPRQIAAVKRALSRGQHTNPGPFEPCECYSICEHRDGCTNGSPDLEGDK